MFVVVLLSQCCQIIIWQKAQTGVKKRTASIKDAHIFLSNFAYEISKNIVKFELSSVIHLQKHISTQTKVPSSKHFFASSCLVENQKNRITFSGTFCCLGETDKC